MVQTDCLTELAWQPLVARKFIKPRGAIPESPGLQLSLEDRASARR